jgi:phosphatidylglycerophosphatase A
MSDRLAKLISTLFSLGYSKYFPGTLGSAAAIPFGLIIIIFLGTNFLIFLIFLLFIISYFAVNIYIRDNKSKDPKEVIIDEFIGQLIVLIFVPLSIKGIILGFIIFRFFDISKIYPVSRAEKLEGSLGVLADDIVAGILTSIIIIFLDIFGII